MNQKGFSTILTIILIVILGLFVAYRKGYVTIGQPNNLNQTQVIPSSNPLASNKPTLNTPPPVFQDNGNYPADPTSVTQNFYDWYISCQNLHFWNASHNSNYPKNITPDQACDYRKSRYASQELIQTLTKFDQDFMKKCGNSPGCDHGDLILCAQNTPDKAVLSNTTINGNGASLTVTLFGNDNIKVDLGLLNNQWKLTNITCQNH